MSFLISRLQRNFKPTPRSKCTLCTGTFFLAPRLCFAPSWSKSEDQKGWKEVACKNSYDGRTASARGCTGRRERRIRSLIADCSSCLNFICNGSGNEIIEIEKNITLKITWNQPKKFWFCCRFLFYCRFYSILWLASCTSLV